MIPGRLLPMLWDDQPAVVGIGIGEVAVYATIGVAMAYGATVGLIPGHKAAVDVRAAHEAAVDLSPGYKAAVDVNAAHKADKVGVEP